MCFYLVFLKVKVLNNNVYLFIFSDNDYLNKMQKYCNWIRSCSVFKNSLVQLHFFYGTLGIVVNTYLFLKQRMLKADSQYNLASEKNLIKILVEFVNKSWSIYVIYEDIYITTTALC